MSSATFRMPDFARLPPLAAAVVVLKVTLGVLLSYRDYLPPNFDSEFLSGRQPYFWGLYGGAFYLHLLSGPTSLVLGTVLVFAIGGRPGIAGWDDCKPPWCC